MAEKIGTVLKQIGIDPDRKQTVDRSTTKIESYKKHGDSWKTRIVTLLGVVKSKKITKLDKAVAYGALFLSHHSVRSYSRPHSGIRARRRLPES